jgi:3-hydroxyacyl-CoA dehydrogenase
MCLRFHVIGAGTISTGIAQTFAYGARVLPDVSEEALKKGLGRSTL